MDPVAKALEPIPLSLYVHIPWCVRKCPYCDFNSHAAREPIPEAAYVEALLRDLEQELPGVWGRRLLSVFIGGGTPSLFSPEAIDRLLAGIRARLALAPETEVTLEANPGTVEVGRFREFRGAGVTRLSIGVQSFDDRLLARIGRIHDGRDARRAAEAAHAAGFGNFNLDLMYALPGQTAEQALADVQSAVALEPRHLSCYQLTLEPNTLFHREPPVLPCEEEVDAIEHACRERMADAGFARYEVSAYARDEARCVHNLNYWQFGDYLGIGAGAHGKLTDHGLGEVRRVSKLRHPRAYLEAAAADAPAGGIRLLGEEDLVLEYAMNALRLTDGFLPADFESRTGLPIAALSPGLEAGIERGLLTRYEGRIRASAQGMRFLDDAVALFLPA